MVDNVILDERVALGFKGGPTFLTDKLGYVGGQEQRLQNRSITIHTYTWSYRNSTRDLIDELKAFFMDRRGDFKTWLLKDWSDYSVTNGAIGAGDGAETDFQTIKIYGTTNPYSRTIRHVKSGTQTVKVDGVTVVNYSVSSTGLITFTGAPSNGALITSSFEFYVPVRFDGDRFIAMVDYPEEIDAMSVEDLTAIEVVP